MMHYDTPRKGMIFHNEKALVDIASSCFVGSSGTEEYHFMLKPVQYGRFSEQLEWIREATDRVLKEHGLQRDSIVFRRFFCSDLVNRIDELRKNPFSDPDSNRNGIISLVTQPPAPPAKLALWVYCINSPGTIPAVKRVENSFCMKRGELEHVWSAGHARPDQSGSHAQTHAIFDDYIRFLESRNMSLTSECVRTWFFVKDVDTNYHGMVVARNEVFADHDLTPDTHFIASTGIEGAHKDVESLVLMDAYAIKGLQQKQVHYLQALDHLSHTHVYGVAFERGTALTYKDRRHVIISGTASIDSEGEIVHKGDVLLQLDRTLENINALLARANASMDDMQHFIVYLRDPCDVEIIRDILKERIGDKPFLVVTAAVCRPSWLIEIEGVAIIPWQDDSMPAF